MIDEKIKNHLLSSPSRAHWEKVGLKNFHGFCLPLFSIRSKSSCGIGEINDLLYLVDWLKKTGLNIIQLLPLNEGYYKDASPYNSLSSCALDPIYLSLSALKYFYSDKQLVKNLRKLQKLNEAKYVKHDKVRKLKFAWLKRYYLLFSKKYIFEKDFLDFKKKHSSWLYPYAAFRYLKDKYKGKNWIDWPSKYKNPTEETIKNILLNNSESEFYIFLQYLLFSQMEKVKIYASQNDVYLKGDIPILINPDSADVWANSKKEIFDKSHVAGAPPDDFNFKGHKWGFYLFNWDKMEKNGYSFWKTRLQTIQDIYHFYRIDHAVGFFRIWAIPPKKKATEGQFYPEDASLWGNLGEKHLQILLDSIDLLPIAEDLGFIPKVVYTVLKKMGIPGTKVLRWQRNIPLNSYEPISLTTLSTHDVEIFDQWWNENPDKAKDLADINNWQYQKKISPDLKKQILLDSHRSSSIFHINLLQEYLVPFEGLTHKKLKKERINISGKVSRKNWRYKYLLPLEMLTTNNKLNDFLKVLIKQY